MSSMSCRQQVLGSFSWLNFHRVLLFCMVGIVLLSFYTANKYIQKQSQRLNMPIKLAVRVRADEYHESDDLLVGKSCQQVTRFGFRTWHCQDCGSNSSTYRKNKCRTLPRKGICYPIRRKQWDQPPRYVSQFDPTSNQTVGLRTLNTVGLTRTYESQPVCTVATCFDLSRCSKIDNESFVLTVFANITGPHKLLDYAVAHTNKNSSNNGRRFQLQRVDRWEDACLVLVTDKMYTSPAEMESALHWQGGRNNLIWDLSHIRHPSRMRLSTDKPFTLSHVGYAAVASVSLSEAYLRSGYDMSLAYQPKNWGRNVPASQVDIHRPRKWLLSFRGRVIDVFGLSGNVLPNSPYYLHRWMAAEYWEDSPDVLVDVQCLENKLLPPRGLTEYKLPASIYNDMIWNTTFGFAPGGNSVGSYRFSEILSTGGIPVVTQDFVAPLAPDSGDRLVWLSSSCQ